MDEETCMNLDEEFRNCLKFIRPYIINLTNPIYITSCRVWLEKMSNCRPQEKSMRNDYLNELCRQIQNGKIEEPFISTPPEGPLVELVMPCSSNSWSDISTISTTTEIPGSGDTHNDHLSPQEKLSFPSIYENKIKEQQQQIDELTRKNNFLSDRLQLYETQLNTRNTKAEEGINMLATEVEYLKDRLKELIIMKRNLQASHNAIIMQWETSSRALEKEVLEQKQKNNEQQVTINELKNKLENFKNFHEMERTASNLEKKLLKVHHVEICDIKEKHSEVIKFIEGKHTSLLENKEAEYDEAIQNLRTSYEQKILDLNSEAEKNYKFRDKEILRLEKLVEVQCDRVQQETVLIRSQIEQDCNYTNDALVDKVGFLQKCILKMEKLLRKYEKHYSKKITFLTNELQMKENTIQIQLTTQRAQLLSKASSERQEEIDNIVLQLEERYRLLLEDQQTQVADIRQEYLNTIAKLSDKFDLKTVNT